MLCFLLVMFSCVACGSKSSQPQKEQTKENETKTPTPEPTPAAPEEPVVQKDTTLTFAGDTMLMAAALANYEKSGTNWILDP